jgi:hypothetical protein
MLLHWLDTAIVAQPFYAGEINAIRMAVGTWRYRLPLIDRHRPG